MDCILHTSSIPSNPNLGGWDEGGRDEGRMKVEEDLVDKQFLLPYYKFMSEEKDKGFSYSSPRVQRKQAAKLLVLELGALAVLIIGILFALVYLNVIPLGPLLQNFDNRSAEQEVKPDDSYTNKNGHTIEVKSDIPGYKVELKNEEKLLTLLEEWKVLDRNYETSYGSPGSTKGEVVKKIAIRLTDNEQRTFRFVGEGQRVTSSSVVEVLPGELSILAHVNPSIVTTDNDWMQKTLRYNLLFVLLVTSDTEFPDETAKSMEKAHKILSENTSASEEYFVIKKQ